MSFRIGNALVFLRERFQVPLPPDLPSQLIRAAPKWECREYRLLLKSCPLGFYDSIAWHTYNFRRIRPFDNIWRRLPLAVAGPQYLLAFFDAPGLRSLWPKLLPHLRLRLERTTRR